MSRRSSQRRRFLWDHLWPKVLAMVVLTGDSLLSISNVSAHQISSLSRTSCYQQVTKKTGGGGTGFSWRRIHRPYTLELVRVSVEYHSTILLSK